MGQGKITILGINGHIGHHAARAFVAAGWEVTGFGRTNKTPIAGVAFISGDADNVAEMRAAIGDADVIVNALNLPYDKWDSGRMEGLHQRVLDAMGTGGKTMIFPGNIYNYAASQRLITPDAPQNPETPRGAIRVRSEALLRAAAEKGEIQLIIVRAGDFYGPDSQMDMFDQVLLREAGKGKLALPSTGNAGHAWAYLPDLGRCFEKLAFHRNELGAVENFHFAGHFVTQDQLVAAVRAASPVPLRTSQFPWGMLRVLGIAMPLLREIVKMRYLWDNPMELQDNRLDAILGPDFTTPYDQAIAATVAPYFAQLEKRAA